MSASAAGAGSAASGAAGASATATGSGAGCASGSLATAAPGAPATRSMCRPVASEVSACSASSRVATTSRVNGRASEPSCATRISATTPVG